MINQLVSASTVQIDPKVENRLPGPQVFSITPGSDITFNALPDNLPGQEYALFVYTSGTTSRTLTFSGNFKKTGTLATGTTDAKLFIIKFISDGQNLCEVSRTAAM